MKQGSTDDPFAEDVDETTSDSPDSDATEEPSPELDEDDDQEPTAESTPPQRRSLPYIHARDGVKDGRTQRPVFLRAHIENGIDELVDQMEGELDEDVYKTDVTEAAMAVAQENPHLVLDKLEEWGYGWA